MTTYSEAPALAATIIALANKATYKDRYKGHPHVTDLTGCLRKVWARRNGIKSAPMSEDEQTMMLAGHAHHMLIQAARGSDEWDVEVELVDDSIPLQGSMDVRMHTGAGETIPLEIKTTRASAKKSPDAWPHYIEQLASYCVMDNWSQQAYIGILHLLGDYTGPKLPKWRMWKLLFTMPELQAWKRELQRRSRIIEAPGLPPLEEHQDWECQYCPYSVMKGGFCPGGEGRNTVFFPMSTRIEIKAYDEDEEE